MFQSETQAKQTDIKSILNMPNNLLLLLLSTRARLKERCLEELIEKLFGLMRKAYKNNI